MNAVTTAYGALAGAIVIEVIATSLLPSTREFTRPVPTIAMLLLYASAFYLLSIALRAIPVGIAYAIWSGLGIVLISAVGVVLFRQTLDMAAIIGLGLIIAGVLVVNLFSKSMPH